MFDYDLLEIQNYKLFRDRELSRVNIAIDFAKLILDIASYPKYKLKSNLKQKILLKGISMNDLQSTDFRNKVIRLITDTDNPKFILQENFMLSPDEHKLVSKDYRVSISDFSGTIPKAVMLNVATVCSFMLIGILSPEVGRRHIVNIVKKFGVAELVYTMEGYMHVRIDKESPIVKFKSNLAILPNFKKKSL